MLPKKRVTTHPGEVLKSEFLFPLGISQSALARHIGVMPFVICEIVNGKRGVSPRMAFMLARAFARDGNAAAVEHHARFWLGLQADHDLSMLTQTAMGKAIAKLKPISNTG
jgi:addiction module HigA family antidote